MSLCFIALASHLVGYC